MVLPHPWEIAVRPLGSRVLIVMDWLPLSSTVELIFLRTRSRPTAAKPALTSGIRSCSSLGLSILSSRLHIEEHSLAVTERSHECLTALTTLRRGAHDYPRNETWRTPAQPASESTFCSAFFVPNACLLARRWSQRFWSLINQLKPLHRPYLNGINNLDS